MGYDTLKRYMIFEPLGLALVALIVWLTAPTGISAETIRIDDISIEIRSNSAVSAKSAAIEKAERSARTALGLDQKGAAGSAAIKYFRVREEKTGPGYYAATFDFAFETEVAAAPLNRPAETGADAAFPTWILAVPVHYVSDDDPAYVWEPEDPWTRHWIMGRINRTVPVIANVADGQDRELLATYSDGDYATLLQFLAEKYGAGAAAFVILDQSDPDNPDASRVLVDYWHPNKGLLSAAVAIDHIDLMAEEVAGVAAQNALRIIQMLASDQDLQPVRQAVIDVPLRLQFDHIDEWRETETSLNTISGATVGGVRIVGNEVSASIAYKGTYTDLIAAVKELGLLQRRQVAAEYR